MKRNGDAARGTTHAFPIPLQVWTSYRVQGRNLVVEYQVLIPPGPLYPDGLPPHLGEIKMPLAMFGGRRAALLHMEAVLEEFRGSFWTILSQMVGFHFVYCFNKSAVAVVREPEAFLKRQQRGFSRAVYNLLGQHLGFDPNVGKPERETAEQLRRRVTRAAKAEWRANRQASLNLEDVAKRLGMNKNTLDSKLKRKRVSWRTIKAMVTSEIGA
jgi:hypothetical protein